MSKILEEKIKRALRGEILSEDKDMKEDPESKKAAEEEEEDDDNPASKEAKKTSKEDNEISKGKREKAEVKESEIPDLGKDLSGVGKETSAGEDNTKILKGRSNREASLGKFSDKVKSDKSDDAGDNERGNLTPGGALKTSEKGGKLSTPMKEHISALFDGETLTEEFITRAEAIFEVALNDLLEEKMEQVQEEYQLQLSEAVDEVKGELVEQIDGYLDYVVEMWIEDNAVALESGMKVELVNSFIDGIKNVFQEHYVDIPEDKLDVIEEQATKIEFLEAELVSIKEEKDIALKEATILRCNEIISDLSEGLTAIEAEKFNSLVENVEFETEDEFESKAKTIRESYFKKGSNNNSQDVTKEKQITESKTSDDLVNATLNVLQGGKLRFVRS